MSREFANLWSCLPQLKKLRHLRARPAAQNFARSRALLPARRGERRAGSERQVGKAKEEYDVADEVKRRRNRPGRRCQLL